MCYRSRQHGSEGGRNGSLNEQMEMGGAFRDLHRLKLLYVGGTLYNLVPQEDSVWEEGLGQALRLAVRRYSHSS